MGKELKFLFTSKCIAISLPTNPSSHGKDPPKFKPMLDHMGKESSFLPCSAPFPSSPPPKKNQCYPSPQILSHLYVWKDSFPLQNAKPHKSSTVKILFNIFIFHFIFILRYHCFEFPFFFFFFKTWNSTPKLKNYSPAFGANNRRIDAPESCPFNTL